MSLTITINLTEVETLALQYIAADPQEWLDSFVKYRANVAIDEIYQKEVQRLISEGADAIPTNKATVVLNAFTTKNVLTAAEANAVTLENLNNLSNVTPT